MNKFELAVRRFIMGIPRPAKAINIRKLAREGEDITSFIIREVTAEDIPALSALHVKTWAQTYWTVSHPPTYKIREWQWHEQFNVMDGSWFCYVIENNKKELVGFAKGKTYSSSDLPEFSGEVNKIYLLREYQRLGLGKKLLCKVAGKFVSMGITNMVLFGAADNPSFRFHEAMGGEKLYSKEGEFHGGYCWKDLQTLAAICKETANKNKS
ncbi:MAG TPA: GNAT family N-acetyltransferase [Chitinophagaceae bacterium]|nr:GNAT family N-acetyltransferase [Chitinophagaceae bacterium]